MTFRYLFLAGLILLLGCNSARTKYLPNPAAPGFNQEGSDPQAIAIADEVMLAQGGRGAWDAMRYLSWNFFGNRTLLWDKFTGNVRIDWLKKSQKVVVNVQTGAGKVWIDETLQTHPDTIAKYLDMGKKVWINDSYWLVMPFKLKDSGVTLKYIGTGKTDSGLDSDILQMTFNGVGVTPDNKYHIWVDKSSKLVRQWAFFEKFSDEQPRFKSPWDDYKKMSPAPVFLSGSRGPGRSLEPVETPKEVPAGSFGY